MITKNQNAQDELIFLTLDDLVPEDHLVRELDKLDYSFIYDEVDDLYSKDGRPSIDPIILFKILTIKQVFQIRSLRQTLKDLEVNIAYRWFVRIPLSEKVPHFTAISHNFNNRFNVHNVGLRILKNIFQQIIDAKLLPIKDLNLESVYLEVTQTLNDEPKIVLDESNYYEMTLV